MQVKILYFGIAKDITGKSSHFFEVEEGYMVHDLLVTLQKEYPKFTGLKEFSIAVNEQYASVDLVLQEHDVVAIIPPVSGG